MSIKITLDSEVRCGFTMSSDGASWCVLSGMTDRGIDRLKRSNFVPRDALSRFDLTCAPGVAKFVEFLLTKSRLPMRDCCAPALGFLMSEEVLLAPPGGLGVGWYWEWFDNGLPSFVDGVLEEIGLANTSYVSKRAASKIWLCTLEGKTQKPDKEAVARFVRAHLHGGKQAKWMPGLSAPAITGLKDLAGGAQVPEASRRWNKLDDIAAALGPNVFFSRWEKWFQQYVETLKLGSLSHHEAAFKYISSLFLENKDLLNPKTLFSTTGNRPNIFQRLSLAYSPKYASTLLKIIYGFFEWVIINDAAFSFPDEGYGEGAVIRAGYSNPIPHSDLRKSESSIDSRAGSLTGRRHMALPLEFLEEIEKILFENDMEWSKRRKEDWLEYTNPGDGRVEKVYCPVLPNLISFLIKLPTRHVQARRLDSGEGDSQCFDLQINEWKRNYGPHSGYWEALNVYNSRRGVLRRITDTWANKDLCGFFINSNKISDRKVLFDERSGYEISWHNLEVIKLVQEMRAWQEKYNSVTEPLSYAKVRKGVFEKMSPGMAKRRPACFYLFRYPAGRFAEWRESPPSGNQLRFFWYEVLAELERRLASRGEHIQLITSWSRDGVPMGSPYTLHGLRYAGLTRLAAAGVHPWILQKVMAGHANLVMTLRYVEPGPAHISDMITEAHVRSVRNKQSEFAQFLSNKSLEEAHRVAVCNGPRGLGEIEAARDAGIVNPHYILSRLDHGICPVGRAKCHEGKALLDVATHKNRELRDVHGPVPPGPHGEPDCSRCIFFITGTPFFEGLRAKTLEVSIAESKCAARHDQMIAEMDAIIEMNARGGENAEKRSPYEDQRLYILKQEIKTEGEILLNLRESLNAHGVLCQKVRALLKLHISVGETAIPALLFEREPQFDWSLQPIGEAIDELCHLAKWYPSIRVEDLRRERREKTGRLFASQGLQIDWFSLSEEEVDAAIEAITAHIYRKLERDRAREVFNNAISFKEAGLTDLQELFSEAIGRSVAIAMPPLLSAASVGVKS